MSNLAVFLLGILFIVLGRALHSRPQWLFPDYWPLASTTKNDFAKFMSISLVFVGSAAALFQLAELMPVKTFVPTVLVLPSSFLLTWLCFRSKRQSNSSDVLNPKE
jgi:hypothetical protein